MPATQEVEDQDEHEEFEESFGEDVETETLKNMDGTPPAFSKSSGDRVMTQSFTQILKKKHSD